MARYYHCFKTLGVHGKMTAIKQLKVIIVGAGFGGLGSAIECAERGMDVTVIEKYPDSNSQGGKSQSE